MKQKEIDDFLWFSYFGITKTDAEKDYETAIKACIIRAYQDVCRQIKYYYSSSGLQNEFKAYKKGFGKLKSSFLSDDCMNGKSAICIICSHIFLLLNNVACEKEEFDAWHSTTCDCLVNFANSYSSGEHILLRKDEDDNEKDSFKYGLAQKWVNLSLKNMIVMGLWNKLEDFEPFLHVTIDSYILKAAAEQNSKNRFALQKPIAPQKHQDENEGAKGYYVEEEKKGKPQTQPWSKLNKADYLRFQITIREELKSQQFKEVGVLTPFDWEWYAWIEQAKLEKKEPSND